MYESQEKHAFASTNPGFCVKFQNVLTCVFERTGTSTETPFGLVMVSVMVLVFIMGMVMVNGPEVS